MNYLFFTGGSGNRGCEAIVRGTKEIFKDETLIVYSAKPEEENDSGLSQIIECRSLNKSVTGISKLWSHLLCWMSYHFGTGKLQVKQIYSDFLKSVKRDDTYFVIGGDVYCYDKPRIYYRVNEILKDSKKILWGCSIEPDKIDKEMIEDLKNYDMIYARESITYNALVSHDIKNNIRLLPDPAFIMKCDEVTLPEGFSENNTIGINISPMIIGLESKNGLALKNYENLIEYILETTDCQIALIPHVIWENNDDREPLNKFLDKYCDTKRVIIVDALPAEKIKSIISKCRIMVAARTHASIAAYSMCVPTLVVGYSVKARGIAKDLFGEYEHYTISVQSLETEGDLVQSFKWIMENEETIRKHLINFIPQYVAQLNELNISEADMCRG